MAQSQGTSSYENSEVEALYDDFDRQETTRRKEDRNTRRKERKAPQPKRLSELATLEPFEDIAVIQRRFLPKTKRFEFSSSLMASVNNPFFTNLGLGLRLAFHFNEKHAVVGQYYLLSNSENDVTSNLREQQLSVETRSITTPQTTTAPLTNGRPFTGR